MCSTCDSLFKRKQKLIIHFAYYLTCGPVRRMIGFARQWSTFEGLRRYQSDCPRQEDLCEQFKARPSHTLWCSISTLDLQCNPPLVRSSLQAMSGQCFCDLSNPKLLKQCMSQIEVKMNNEKQAIHGAKKSWAYWVEFNMVQVCYAREMATWKVCFKYRPTDNQASEDHQN